MKALRPLFASTHPKPKSLSLEANPKTTADRTTVGRIRGFSPLLPWFMMILLLGLLFTACGENNTLDNNVATLNAAATRVASGAIISSTQIASVATPQPTVPPNLYDLTRDLNASLASAWGPIYGLQSGSEFTIIADQQQVGTFVIQELQLAGWDDVVKGGSITIGAGQIRLDVALVDGQGGFGSGTVTYQPTLDAMGRVHLNAQGYQGFKLPTGLLPAFGDAVHTALTGAPNDTLTKVTLSRLSADNGTLEVAGRVR